jgi:hypothetical protein
MGQKWIGKEENGESDDAFSIRNTVKFANMGSNRPHRLLHGCFLLLRVVTGRDNVSG